MLESLIGEESTPNVHIESISHQKTGDTHYFLIKVLMFDSLSGGWSTNSRFTEYLRTKLIISNSQEISNSLINGEITINSNKLKNNFSQIFSFSEFKYEKTTYKNNDLKKYSHEIKVEVFDEKNQYDNHSQVFIASFIDMEQKIKDKNLFFSKNKKNYLGSVKSEIVFPKIDLCYAFLDDDNNVWTGPTHEHEGTVMAGSQHIDMPHKKLKRIQLKRRKIEYGTEPKMEIEVPSRQKKNPKPTIPVRKNRTYVLQKEFSEDHDRNLANIAIINLEQILLEESFYAKTIDSRAPDILENISKNLNIKNIEISRYRHKSRKNNKRSLYFYKRSVIDKSTKKIIAKSSNANRFIEKKELFETRLNKRLSVNKSQIILDKPNKIYNGKTITKSLLKDSFKIGEVEQLNLTLPENFRAVSFTDYSIKRSKTGTYSYKIRLSFKDESYLYCKKTLNDLMKYSRNIETLYTTLIMKNSFKQGQFSRQFLKEFYSQYDVNYDEINNRINGPFNTESLKNSYLYKAFETLLSAERLLNVKIRSDEHIESLNLFSSNLEKINNTIQYYNKIIVLFKKTFNLSDGQSTDKVAGKAMKDRSTIEVVLSLPKKYEKKALVPIGINFIANNKFNGIPKIDLSFLINRGNTEVSKFFVGNINTNSDSLSFLKTGLKKDFADLDKDKMKFFSPSKFFLGRKEVDVTEINPTSFDADFFNSLRTIKSSIETGESIEEKENFMDEQEIDHFIDSRDYLGSTTKFNNIILNSIRLSNFKNIKKVRKKFRLLDNKIIKSNNKNISLNTFNLKQPGNLMSKKIELKEKIPMQLKALSLLNTSMTKFDLETIDFDPVSNPQTQETFQQNYLNLNKLVYLEGFEKVNGKFSLEKPIYKEIEMNEINKIKQKNVLAELIPFTIDNITPKMTGINIHDKNIFIENLKERQIREELSPIIPTSFVDSVISSISISESPAISVESLYNFEFSTVRQISQSVENNNFSNAQASRNMTTPRPQPRIQRSRVNVPNQQINRTQSFSRGGY